MSYSSDQLNGAWNAAQSAALRLPNSPYKDGVMLRLKNMKANIDAAVGNATPLFDIFSLVQNSTPVQDSDTLMAAVIGLLKEISDTSQTKYASSPELSSSSGATAGYARGAISPDNPNSPYNPANLPKRGGPMTDFLKKPLIPGVPGMDWLTTGVAVFLCALGLGASFMVKKHGRRPL